MKKVKIEKIEQPKPQIDWGKKQWVQNDIYPEIIVQTTGAHNGDEFTGMSLPCEKYKNGFFTENWIKETFHYLTDDIPFIISNKED